MNNLYVACDSSKTPRRDRLRRKFINMKSSLYLWGHGIFWRTLHKTKTARFYSVNMCKLNLYRKFPDGRCMWCGNIHGVQK